jgi:pilus assembly protein FimV
VIDKLRGAIVAAVLLAVAGPAAALGLGQIQVKSRVDQPLLAEIPIISSDPAELERLQARLASPETFRRVGLEPPSGIAADLQFSVALDARGNPVIRVTSTQPVNQPLVSFLVEVDWGQGRLVREYSALLDTPNTVAAPAQPPIQAPVAAPSNVIEQPVAAPVAVEPEPDPETQAPVEPAPAEQPQPERAPVVAAPPQPTAPSAPVATPAPGVDPDQLRVERGDTLSELAAGLAAGRDYTLDQTMLALLRANPEAFIDDNINLLKSGAVLRIPDASEVASFSRAEAAAVVRDHVERWQASRAPAPQPAAVAGTAGDAGAGDASVAGGARVAGARLEIAPPTGEGNTPGTRSGTSAGGEGDMLRQEMQAKEDLAARTAEVEELKARVAELEKLQQQQQQLISMKDSELAAAQQRLADAREAGTVAAPGQAQSAATPWIWGGAGLVALGLLAWLFSRRRKPVVEPRRSYDTAALAAGMPGAGRGDDLFGDQAEETGAEPEPVPPVEPPRWTAAPSTAAPTWHGAAPVGLAAATAVDAADASQKLELARAYLDLGDDDAARAVLREVLDGRDPVARETAAALLRDL